MRPSPEIRLLYWVKWMFDRHAFSNLIEKENCGDYFLIRDTVTDCVNQAGLKNHLEDKSDNYEFPYKFKFSEPAKKIELFQTIFLLAASILTPLLLLKNLKIYLVMHKWERLGKIKENVASVHISKNKALEKQDQLQKIYGECWISEMSVEN